MSNKGKELEELVKTIEKLLLPNSFSVTANEKVFNDEGIQIAEFDIEINGIIGSTNFKWLIECRDRPGEGSAPGSWIEQLVGRRNRFKFDKVIAVSTTGFAQGAIDYAKNEGIALRNVEKLTPESVNDWFATTYLHLTHQNGKLLSIIFEGNKEIAQDLEDALKEKIAKLSTKEPILLSTKDGKFYNIIQAWQGVMDQATDLFKGVEKNASSKVVKLSANYNDPNDRYRILTDKGPVDIVRILFKAELTITTSEIPISEIRQYSKIESSETISQTIHFQADINDKSINFDIHRIPHKDSSTIVVQMSQSHKKDN